MINKMTTLESRTPIHKKKPEQRKKTRHRVGKDIWYTYNAKGLVLSVKIELLQSCRKMAKILE